MKKIILLLIALSTLTAFSQNKAAYLINTKITTTQTDEGVFLQRDLTQYIGFVASQTDTSVQGSDEEAMWLSYFNRPHPNVTTVEKYFNEASLEFGVPAELLKAIGQVENNWTQVGPSIDKGWGIMHLVDNNYCSTLKEAAALLHLKPQILKDNPRQNIRGAAALIKKYHGNKKHTKLEDWFDAIKEFSGLINNDLKEQQAERYYQVLKDGVETITVWDETVKITPHPGINISNKITYKTKQVNSTDYAPAISGIIPSCNYSSRSGQTIDTWVNHYIGTGTYAGAISWFNNCSAQVSAHFVIRSSDGQITQCVAVADKAWHCGATGYPLNNSRSIGVEHEATSANPSLWNSTPMLTASANMSCYFAQIYPIPVSFHTSPGILGHQEMPGTNTDCPGALPWTTWIGYFNACYGSTPSDPTNLSAVQSACPIHQVAFSWANSGSGWHIDISTSINFTSYWWKYVSNLTTYTGPAGFVDHVDGVTPLVFQPGTTYYWRVTNSNGGFDGPSFTVYLCDTIPPTTSVTVPAPNAWVTGNFTATVNDVDNTGGSGIEKGYYQITDFNGSKWSANASRGFFYDDFDTLNGSLWTIPASSGTWAVSGGMLSQSDETVNNTNIYTPLTQNLSNRYLYQFNAKAGGNTSPNRRFGFHYFCDDATLLNRGNSYFVWFRLEDKTLEFFKVINNVFDTAQKVIHNITTTPDQFYDFKIIYDRISGKTDVYRDNILLGTWTDNAPFNSGNAISFRTGNAQMTVKDLNVYRSRTSTPNITVGTPLSDIRYQNTSPVSPAARIKSIAADSASNLSPVFSYTLNVDWTIPTCVTVNDGLAADQDTATSNGSLSANWTTSADANSGIAKYWYAIGTTAGATDVVGWTDNALNTSVTKSGLSLIAGQTYYFSVKAENGAGLNCIESSDGIFADINTGLTSGENPSKVEAYMNPLNFMLNITLMDRISDNVKMELFDVIGNSILQKPLNETHYSIDLSYLASGVYILKISSKEFDITKKIVKH